MGVALRRAAIFDLDGTLVDSAMTMTFILNTMRQQRGMPILQIDKVRGWVSSGAEAIVRMALGDKITNLVEQVAEFRKIYSETQPDPSELFPHTHDMLLSLKHNGYTVALCTNKPQKLAQHVAEGVGIAPLLDLLVGGRPGLPPKPDPAPIFETLQLLQIDTADAVYIGDSPLDAEAAQAASMPFIWANFEAATTMLPCVAWVDDFRLLPAKLLELHKPAGHR